jgi:hypothetical protein
MRGFWMSGGVVRWALAVAVAGAVLVPPDVAWADEVETPAHAEAQKHFAKARELYGQGNYKEARVELLEAKKLDPQSKELVFNLGVVAEKLVLFDEALEQFRAYREMTDVTDQEKARAESIILRLEGAKKQLADQKKLETPKPVEPEPPKAPEAPPPKGRIDAATIVAAGVGVVGLSVGAIFGIKALGERPSGFTTGRDGSYADFVSKNDSAHTSAIVSDIGFAVGVVGVAAAAVLYFARPKVMPARVGLAPIVGPGQGGLVLVGGWQ